MTKPWDHAGSCSMESGFWNVYDDSRRAAAYDELGLGGTYLLVFRNLPVLLGEHVVGRRALDFGCGTGRSTRFLKAVGFDVVGVDISEEMVRVARQRDPAGDYHVISDGDLSALGAPGFDLVLSAFTFDNVSGHERKVRLFGALGGLLSKTGLIVNIVSTPEIYTNEWVTFSTREFSENRTARAGDVVRIVTTDYSDSRPVEDILCPDKSYQAVYREAGLQEVRVERPLATGREGVFWKSETRVAPWAIYVLGNSGWEDA